MVLPVSRWVPQACVASDSGSPDRDEFRTRNLTINSPARFTMWIGPVFCSRIPSVGERYRPTLTDFWCLRCPSWLSCPRHRPRKLPLVHLAKLQTTSPARRLVPAGLAVFWVGKWGVQLQAAPADEAQAKIPAAVSPLWSEPGSQSSSEPFFATSKSRTTICPNSFSRIRTRPGRSETDRSLTPLFWRWSEVLVARSRIGK